MHRAGYLILWVAPLLIAPLTGSRAMRIPFVHEIVGILLFAIIGAAAWWASRPETGSRSELGSLLRGRGRCC